MAAIITENEILAVIKENRPDASETDLKWALFHYCKDNGLQRIGKKQYAGSALVYEYIPGEKAAQIQGFLQGEFPDMEICIWESALLNEWMNLLLANNTIFVETGKECVESVYYALCEKSGEDMILVNPSLDDYYRYLRNDLIVIRTLKTRAPITRNGHITLEKLIVDLLYDKFLSQLIDRSTAEAVIADISKRYIVNESRLYAYAKRRNKMNEVQDFWRKLND